MVVIISTTTTTTATTVMYNRLANTDEVAEAPLLPPMTETAGLRGAAIKREGARVPLCQNIGRRGGEGGSDGGSIGARGIDKRRRQGPSGRRALPFAAAGHTPGHAGSRRAPPKLPHSRPSP